MIVVQTFDIGLEADQKIRPSVGSKSASQTQDRKRKVESGGWGFGLLIGGKGLMSDVIIVKQMILSRKG